MPLKKKLPGCKYMERDSSLSSSSSVVSLHMKNGKVLQAILGDGGNDKWKRSLSVFGNRDEFGEYSSAISLSKTGWGKCSLKLAFRNSKHAMTEQTLSGFHEYFVPDIHSRV